MSLAEERALARKQMREDAWPIVDCPVCGEPVACYVLRGMFEIIDRPCSNRCHERYSEDDREQLAESAVNQADYGDREVDL